MGMAFIVSSFFFSLYYSTGSWSSLLQGRGDFRKFMFYFVMRSSINALSIIVCIFVTNNIFVIFLAYVIPFSLVNIILFLINWKAIRNMRDDKIWRSGGYKLTGFTFLSFIYDYLDKIIIGILLGPINLAIYSISASIVIKLRSLTKETLKVISPRIFLSEGIIRICLKNSLYYIIYFIIFILLLSIAWLSLPYMINLLFTEKYLLAIKYARILLFALPFSGLSVVLNMVFISNSRESLVVKLSTISTIINVVLYLSLIPMLGLMGAVISTVIHSFINILLQLYIASKMNLVKISFSSSE